VIRWHWWDDHGYTAELFQWSDACSRQTGWDWEDHWRQGEHINLISDIYLSIYTHVTKVYFTRSSNDVLFCDRLFCSLDVFDFIQL